MADASPSYDPRTHDSFGMPYPAAVLDGDPTMKPYHGERPTENCCATKACHPDGRRFLMDHARDLRQRADNIDALLRSMPGLMSPEAEEAFFVIAIRSIGKM